MASHTVPAGLPAVSYTLHPGDVRIGERGDRLETLLGSCVAIVLTDPRRTLGAMCHFVHAGRPAGPEDDATSFGAGALAALHAGLQQRRIVPRLCEAFVYGGADLPEAAGGSGVGGRNARWALAALNEQGHRVLHVDVGGTHARKLRWTVGPEMPQVCRVDAEVAP